MLGLSHARNPNASRRRHPALPHVPARAPAHRSARRGAPVRARGCGRPSHDPRSVVFEGRPVQRQPAHDPIDRLADQEDGRDGHEGERRGDGDRTLVQHRLRRQGRPWPDLAAHHRGQRQERQVALRRDVVVRRRRPVQDRASHEIRRVSALSPKLLQGGLDGALEGQARRDADRGRDRQWPQLQHDVQREGGRWFELGSRQRGRRQVRPLAVRRQLRLRGVEAARQGAHADASGRRAGAGHARRRRCQPLAERHRLAGSRWGGQVVHLHEGERGHRLRRPELWDQPGGRDRRRARRRRVSLRPAGRAGWRRRSGGGPFHRHRDAGQSAT